ncbi:MAG TPA: lysine 2,3-aminomutase [Anaerolineales bacterium]|nr:lysine 2,3-aminomutase [Anaerolineales bacterium]
MYRDVPPEKWNDWRWQLSNRLNSAADIGQVIHLTDSERKALTASSNLFRVDITPYFLSLIDPENPNDPIRKQVIPTVEENSSFVGMMEDSLAEDRDSPVPGLTHRYPDRVLMMVTTQCATYCRYCTRSRIVGDPTETFSRSEFEQQINYIRENDQIRDVIISGGDPLILPMKILEEILARLREIEHVEMIRIGTRVPVFLPMRITAELTDMLQKYHPLWMNIHVNHPNEITEELARAADLLTRAGIPLGNQTVLMAGVNDCVHIQRALIHNLLRIRVRPYYLFQCDLVEGAGHFRTPVGKGIEIIEGLRGHTSGLGVPVFAIDAPGGGGKVPLMPNYLLSMSEHNVVIRNYEGYVAAYEESASYVPHDPNTCEYCNHKRLEPGQVGLTGLLEGEETSIKPDGLDYFYDHRRNAP